MGEFGRLTAAQIREMVLAQGEWIGERRHRAEDKAEMFDEDGALAHRDRADRVGRCRWRPRPRWSAGRHHQASREVLRQAKGRLAGALPDRVAAERGLAPDHGRRNEGAQAP